MASTSTLHNSRQVGFFRVTRRGQADPLLFPLREARGLSSGIDVAAEGGVYENQPYRCEVLIPSDICPDDVVVHINGSDEKEASLVSGDVFEYDSNTFKVYPVRFDDDWPFFLTFGFARVFVSLFFSDGEEEIALETKAIPCLSVDERQSELVSEMLSTLLDDDSSDMALEWMLTRKSREESDYSLMEGSLRKASSKSLQSFIQLAESSLLCLENEIDYFRSQAFCRIAKTTEKVTLSKVRKVGQKELLWLSKNSEAMEESLTKTSISYFGKYYLPKYLEAETKVKSFNNYENQLVIGFIEEIERVCKSVLKSLESEKEEMSAIERRLLPYCADGKSISSINVIKVCSKRWDDSCRKLNMLIKRAKKIKYYYSKAIPEVEPKFSRTPRQTKAFQELEPYARVFHYIKQWLLFGDYSLGREGLALHTLKLDKIYEYYVLLMILKWFVDSGFIENTEYTEPIQSVKYSWKSKWYQDEIQVSNMYALKRGDLSVFLHYQPIIYGDAREENGIILHRKSARNAFGEGRYIDSVWIPDYLIRVERKDGSFSHFVLDAKYSTIQTVAEGYPRSGRFAEALLKYQMDIGASQAGAGVDAVWLICGKEKEMHVRYSGCSSWDRANDPIFRSGICTLTPESNGLNVLLDELIDGWHEENANHEGDVLLGEEQEAADDSTAWIDDDRNFEQDALMKKIRFLFESLPSPDVMFEQEWSQKTLGLSRPLLRRGRLSQSEKRKYSTINLGGRVCHCCSWYLPPQKAKLDSVCAKMGYEAG